MKSLYMLPVLLVSLTLVGCGQVQKIGDDVVAVPTQKAVENNVDQGQDMMKDEHGEPIKLASTSYIPYATSTMDTARENNKKVAVFFHSKTCSSCAKLEENINDNLKNIPEDVVILKADWDEHQDLAAEWGVEKYHTVTYIHGGDVKNVKGLFTLEELMNEFSLVDEPTAIDPKEEVIAHEGFVPFTAGNYEQARKDDKKVAVFFHSKTCGSCAKLEENINENVKEIPEDVVILKADWDDNQDLAAEWGVEKYHTVTFLGEDDARDNVKGLFTLEELMGNFGG